MSIKALLEQKVRDTCEVRPGVYRFFANDELIYIGRSRELRHRLLSYFRAPRKTKAHRISTAATHLEWQYTPSEFACHLLELRLIKEHRPAMNWDLKEEDRFVFIGLSQSKAPKLVLSDAPTEFGPFRSPRRMRLLVKNLSDRFQLRTSAEKTPLLDLVEPLLQQESRCFRGKLGLCLAPCTGRISFGSYAERLEEAKAFLRGDSQALLASLREKMLDAAAKQQYERAALFRDRLQALERLSGELLARKESLQWLSFVYAVPSESMDMLYMLHGGRVIGALRRPRSPEERSRACALAAALLSAPPTLRSAAEVDELRVMASWFRTHPQELGNTVSAETFLANEGFWPLRRKVS